MVPLDAAIYVDGERWTMPRDQERLTLHLAPGRHRIEVRKVGFEIYNGQVDIRRGDTSTVNVSLVR